ncbi:hypothetical protein Mal35_33630 [Gimesia maris]|nr:hypothetical protein Mal35_33630 [Gimesia maris]
MRFFFRKMLEHFQTKEQINGPPGNLINVLIKFRVGNRFQIFFCFFEKDGRWLIADKFCIRYLLRKLFTEFAISGAIITDDSGLPSLLSESAVRAWWRRPCAAAAASVSLDSYPEMYSLSKTCSATAFVIVHAPPGRNCVRTSS